MVYSYDRLGRFGVFWIVFLVFLLMLSGVLFQSPTDHEVGFIARSPKLRKKRRLVIS